MSMSDEQIKQYIAEGAAGIKNAMLEDDFINFMLEGETDKRYIQTVISLATLINSEINTRIKVLGADLALEAVTKEFTKSGFKEEI